MAGMPMFGASFVPSEENAGLAGKNAAQEPISQAIQYLALRLPQFRGAMQGGMSPGQLMQPHILSYQGPDPIVRAAMEQALGGYAPGGSPGGSMAPPQITPGMGGGVTPPQITPGEQGTRTSGPSEPSASPWREPQYRGAWRGKGA